ncbi:hypothetical protein [uncultured Parabacteroides sp.]|uniref:hypothetical protein n=1 Tax=uncultured Parabacteroides sp. TaxID=512312 RepID=UPI00265B350D|nr:hypothetical protein [uncultured Parabacteroides sp.]
MSEVAKNISELLSGTYGKTIIVGGKVYVIKAPAIKVIMRATRFLSKVNLPENGTMQELMEIVSVNLENIVKGLSYLVTGDVPDYQEKAESLERQMLSGSKEELLQAYFVAFELITGRDFFVVCQLAMELANLTVKPKS